MTNKGKVILTAIVAASAGIAVGAGGLMLLASFLPALQNVDWAALGDELAELVNTQVGPAIGKVLVAVVAVLASYSGVTAYIKKSAKRINSSADAIDAVERNGKAAVSEIRENEAARKAAEAERDKRLETILSGFEERIGKMMDESDRKNAERDACMRDVKAGVEDLAVMQVEAASGTGELVRSGKAARIAAVRERRAADGRAEDADEAEA